MKAGSSEDSWQPRAKLHGWAKAQWLPLQRMSGGSGAKARTRAKKHTDTCSVGVADWLVHSFESNTDCGFKEDQTQNRTMVDQPAKVTPMISIVELHQREQTNPSDSTPSCLKCQTNVGKHVGGNTCKILGIKQIFTIHGGDADTLTKGSFSQEWWTQLRCLQRKKLYVQSTQMGPDRISSKEATMASHRT